MITELMTLEKWENYMKAVQAYIDKKGKHPHDVCKLCATIGCFECPAHIIGDNFCAELVFDSRLSNADRLKMCKNKLKQLRGD